jgi:hypothetical protein
MFSLLYLQAGFTFVTGRIGSFAIQRLRNIDGKRHFAHMAGAGKQKSMGKIILLETAVKQRNNAVLPDYPPHILRPLFLDL